MKGRLFPRPFLFFILAQIITISLLLVMSRRPDLFLPSPVFLLIILVTFVTYIYTFYEFVSYIRKLYIAEYSHRLEKNCRSLLTSYQSFGAQQREFQKETHDILNAQFTYHSLLDQGKKDEAERYRLQKQEEWRQKS